MTSILESTNYQSPASSDPSDSASTELNRLEFWIDTCREVTEMRIRSPQVLELYQKQGCCFLAPTYDQVRVVLNALDAAMKGWELQHPELFYQALELNFPELVRRRLA
jgi:hypothetical protein